MVEAKTDDNVIRYFVGVDGGDASEAAYQVVQRGLRRKDDHLIVGTVHNARKGFLPFNMKPEYIREIYTCKLKIGDKGQFHSLDYISEPETGVTTQSTLWNMAQENKASVIVTGMHGRKGAKADPTVAGSTVRYLANAGTIPILIVKDPIVRDKKKDGKYRFGVCFDTSRQSKTALRQVLCMMNPDDHLTVIVVKEYSIVVEKVQGQIDEICAEFNVSHHRVKVLDNEGNCTIYKTIKHYLVCESHEGNYVDFIAVGNNGVSRKFSVDSTLGSVAEAVIRAQRMNVLFCPV